MSKVVNIPTTSRFKPYPKGCSTWLDFWEKETRTKARKCAVCGCTHDLVGAHVRKTHGNADNRHYIIPFCRSCNAKTTEEFCVSDDLLVPVVQN